MQRELRVNGVQHVELLALGLGRQRIDVARCDGSLELRLQRVAAAVDRRYVHGREPRVRGGEFLFEGLLARLHHVVERAETLRPGGEVLRHPVKGPVVLEPFLELVARKQVVQVARFRRVGQRRKLGEPAAAAVVARLHCRVEQVARADRADRFADARALGVVGCDRLLVVFDGLRHRAELGIGVRHGEIGFLDRGIEEVAALELLPRKQRRLVLLRRCIGPAGAEQRLARQRAIEAHALERDARGGRLSGLQMHIADCKVGLVTQRHELGPLRLDLPDAVEHCEAALRLPRAHQGDAEVELSVEKPVTRPLPNSTVQ